MTKRKIAGLITGAVLLTSTVTFSSALNSNHKKHTPSKVLLASHKTTNKGIVINDSNSSLVLYKNADAKSSVVSYLSVGEMVNIEGSNSNFYKVQVESTGAVGYISSANLISIQNNINTKLDTMSKSGQVINVSSKVHIRSNASLNSSIVTSLNNGNSLEILGLQGNWYKVNANGNTGYIYKTYVGINKEVTTTNNKVAVNKNNNISASKATPKVVAKTNTTNNTKSKNLDLASNATDTIVVSSNNSQTTSTALKTPAPKQVKAVTNVKETPVTSNEKTNSKTLLATAPKKETIVTPKTPKEAVAKTDSSNQYKITPKELAHPDKSLVFNAPQIVKHVTVHHIGSKNLKFISGKKFDKFVNFTGITPIYNTLSLDRKEIATTAPAKGENYTPLFISYEYKLEVKGVMETWYAVNYSTANSPFNTGFIKVSDLNSQVSYMGNANTSKVVNLETGNALATSNK